ncbi:solute carrier organic anion transporter family member 4C1-like isoform X1 [Diaphorina citri]|uniref:Solute carrier organic anion transporter family member n=1 Tax=Diaphorina citri TaxID=121845 RepID=A0A3Q0JH99_DIACI|nr:solute carrier organic anion transporter family member 4C1-like isoform X1 [Diaphorina citri]
MVQLVDSNLGSGTVDINQRTNSNHEANHSEQDKMLSTMKKELSKKELKEEVREKLKDIKDNLEITKDIRCGFGFIQGKILQKFATQEVFVLLYGILGATIQAGASYFSGTISTLEKRYRIPSRNMGVILTGNDIILALFGIPITYYAGRKHKPRWMCIGMLFIVAFCLLNTFPHVIYGSGKEALALTKEYEEDHYSSLQNATDESLCSKEGVECIKEGSLIPQAIFFVSQLMWGIGSPLYGNLGMAYMDDNIKRSKTPILISFSFFIKMLGPVGGYCLAAWCLNMFISPELTPTIITKDPRWLGAWWLGWVIVAVIMAFFSFMIALFPKELPDRAVRKLLEDQTKDEVTKKKEEVEAQISWKDMKITFGRLLRNKILMCSTVGSLFYCFGYYPYWTYMPKYIEMQYKVSASKSSLITGVVGLVFTALGIISSGAFVSKVRPRARCLGGFNVFAGVVTILGIFSYTLLGCAEGDDFNAMIGRVNSSSFSAQKMTTCNADCNCDFSRYSPICSMDGTNMTYISPCHAGCRSSQILDDGSKVSV